MQGGTKTYPEKADGTRWRKRERRGGGGQNKCKLTGKMGDS